MLAGVVLMTLVPVSTAGQQPRLAAGYWTRGLSGGWGHAWQYGVPGWGKTESDVRFAAFHPQLGRFVTDHLEIHGEATLLAYGRPARALSGGSVWAAVITPGGTGDGRPTSRGGAGLLWTSLDVPEIDRVFNFTIVYGLGIRTVPRLGPGLVVEVRNHHISNAGTAGENLGLNAAAVVVGVQWVLRPAE